MADEWKDLAEQAFDLFKTSLKDFVDDQELDKFARERIEQYAKEWWASTNGPDAERAEHSANLVHLTAQARGEARRLQIAATTEVKDVIGRILEMVGNTFLKFAPGIIKLLG